MKKATIYLPTNYNNGDDVASELLDNIQLKIAKMAGGLTNKGKVQGLWISDQTGQIMEDINIHIETAIQENQLNELQEYLEEVKEILNQEALYFEYDNEVTFI